jgi:hypothetical protein
MKATCRCGGEWEIKDRKPAECLQCGTTDVAKIARQELSVSEDFLPWDLPANPLRKMPGEMEPPEPMPLSGPDLTGVGHLIQGIEHLAHALRSAFIDKGMVRADGERTWDSEWTDAAKRLEHDACNLRRRLEEFARKTGAQLYMLEC